MVSGLALSEWERAGDSEDIPQGKRNRITPQALRRLKKKKRKRNDGDSGAEEEKGVTGQKASKRGNDEKH